MRGISFGNCVLTPHTKWSLIGLPCEWRLSA